MHIEDWMTSTTIRMQWSQCISFNAPVGCSVVYFMITLPSRTTTQETVGGFGIQRKKHQQYGTFLNSRCTIFIKKRWYRISNQYIYFKSTTTILNAVTILRINNKCAAALLYIKISSQQPITKESTNRNGIGGCAIR